MLTESIHLTAATLKQLQFGSDIRSGSARTLCLLQPYGERLHAF